MHRLSHHPRPFPLHLLYRLYHHPRPFPLRLLHSLDHQHRPGPLHRPPLPRPFLFQVPCCLHPQIPLFPFLQYGLHLQWILRHHRLPKFHRPHHHFPDHHHHLHHRLLCHHPHPPSRPRLPHQHRHLLHPHSHPHHHWHLLHHQLLHCLPLHRHPRDHHLPHPRDLHRLFLSRLPCPRALLHQDLPHRLLHQDLPHRFLQAYHLPHLCLLHPLLRLGHCRHLRHRSLRSAP
eukprot:jgi/Botrbrau1/21144/Bobra.0061s0038.1